MNKYKYFFFLSIVTLCIPCYVKSMESIERGVKNVVDCLSKHSDKICAATIAVVVISAYLEDSTSDDQEKEILAKDMSKELKKMNGKELRIPTNKIDTYTDDDDGYVDPILLLLFKDMA